MSADNGIYILKTLAQGVAGEESARYEYRVTHAQAIENIYWDHEKGQYREDNQFTPEEAFHYFGRAPVFREHIQAMEHAGHLAQDCDILEYGICLLDHSDQVFQTFTPDELSRQDAHNDEPMARRKAKDVAERQAKLQAATVSFREGMVFEPNAIYGYLVKEDGTKVHGRLSGIRQLTTWLERIGSTAYAVHTECIIGRGETLEFLPSDWHKG